MARAGEHRPDDQQRHDVQGSGQDEREQPEGEQAQAAGLGLDRRGAVSDEHLRDARGREDDRRHRTKQGEFSVFKRSGA